MDAEKDSIQKFKLGKKSGHTHARSHSRNASISSLKSLTTGDDFSHFSLPLTNHNGATKQPRPLSLPPLAVLGGTSNRSSVVLSTPSIPAANPLSNKRSSHHRRRSSVSTRHESAELMGLSVPNLPPAAPEDNVNFGEKDSIRRRALWALEGKSDVAFHKVEIPDFSTTDMEIMISSKPSLTPSNPPIYSNGLNVNNKRDSFKLLTGSSSSKDHLQTLVEEEEEDEDSLEAKAQDSLPSPAPSIKENIPPSAQPFQKPRPATLNLRPLSLTPENLITTPPSNHVSRTGLRALALVSASGMSDDSTKSETLWRSPQSVAPAAKRPVLNLVLGQVTDSPADCEEKRALEKRSSISYKRTSNSIIVNPTGLPTPEMTPTSGCRFSTSGSSYSISSSVAMSEEDLVFNRPIQPRPLSSSEQHFLFKSHHALLARITDLEKALSLRMRDSTSDFSRRQSVSSVVSGMSDSENRSVIGSTEGPSDEMLRLIADLKAERDELKRDVDGWRQRVNNLESQTTVLIKRVESERREAWMARSKAGLLEVEKGVLTQKLETVDELIEFHEKEKKIWDKEKSALEQEVQDYIQQVGELEDELVVVKRDLQFEKARAAHDPLATPTPFKSFENSSGRPMVISPPRTPQIRNHGFASVDSESSTDVEFDVPQSAYALGYDDGLVGYEDEVEGDDIELLSSSSFDSDELNHPMLRQRLGLPPTPITPTMGVYEDLPTEPIPSSPQNLYHTSLSMNWTFPRGSISSDPVNVPEAEGVDRFFNCLDDSDSEADDSSPSSFSYENSKGIFARGFALVPEGDDMTFFLPSGVGVPLLEEPVTRKTHLEVVTEEEEEPEEEEVENVFEDDMNMLGEIGGIKFTFTPPQEDKEEAEADRIQVSPPEPMSASLPPMLPALNFGDEDDTFNFGRPLLEERMPSPPERFALVSNLVIPPTQVAVEKSDTATVSPPVKVSLPHRSPCRPPSVSMIPRVVSPPASSRVIPLSPATPAKNLQSYRMSPTASEKYLPRQPSIRDAPTPPPKLRTAPMATFIPQPAKRSPPSEFTKGVGAGSSRYGSTMPAIILILDEKMNVTLNRSIAKECRSFFNSFIRNDQQPVSQMSIDCERQQHTRFQNSSSDFNVYPSSIDTAPFVTPPPSTTTRLAFQTLTNLVSWTSRNRSSSTQASVPATPTRSTSSTQGSPPLTERGVVSREKQLHRLRIQMEGVGIQPCVGIQCKKCRGEVVVV